MSDVVVRLPKESTFTCIERVLDLLDDRTDVSVQELLSDPKLFLTRLDTDGHTLVLHRLAEKLDTIHQAHLVDALFELPPFYRLLQDADKNSVLHILARRGVDILRHGRVGDLVYRNVYGNTPLHWLAKYPEFHERISVLPYHVVCVKNNMGLTALDVLEKVRADAEAEEYRVSAIGSYTATAALPTGFKLELSDSHLSDFLVGFEFEFATPSTRQRLAELLKLAQLPVGIITDEYGIHKYSDSGYTKWHITGDTTIEPARDEDNGIELVSPPMTFSSVRATLATIWHILQATNSYANESCGLHVSISHKGGGLQAKNFDPIKLALFLGDDKLLNKFDRANSTSCQAFLSYVRGVVHAEIKTGYKHVLNPYNVAAMPVLHKDKKGSPQAAPNPMEIVKSIARDPKTRVRLINSFDKDLSLNLMKLYDDDEVPILEYRALGGDWLKNTPLLFENLSRRLASAAKAAMDPMVGEDAYRALIERDILRGPSPTLPAGLDTGDFRDFLDEEI